MQGEGIIQAWDYQEAGFIGAIVLEAACVMLKLKYVLYLLAQPWDSDYPGSNPSSATYSEQV